MITLVGSRAEGLRHRVRLAFPSTAGPAMVWKEPLVDRHLPGHPGFAAYQADEPLQAQTLPVVPGDTQAFPIAYVIRQDPRSVIEPHFHRVEQFQVFVEGGGVFGRLPFEPVMAQYAAPYTTYGPIKAGPQGVTYYTLRPHWDPGAAWMPASRADLRRHRRAPFKVARTCEPDAGESFVWNVLAEPGGLAIARRIVSRGGQVEVPMKLGDRIYVLLLVGSGEVNGMLADEGAAVFVAAAAPGQLVVVPSTGADVVMLRFPTAPQSQAIAAGRVGTAH